MTQVVASGVTVNWSAGLGMGLGASEEKREYCGNCRGSKYDVIAEKM